MTETRPLAVGDRVRLRSTGEVGVVVHTWGDAHLTHNYVAFFGHTFPTGEPDRLPYILRYATESLELLSPPT